MSRARRLSSLLALTLGFGLTVGVTACDDEDSDIGQPCESIRDCSGDHICDIHDGLGTCQVEHEHRFAGEDPLPLDVEDEDEDEDEAAPVPDVPNP